MKTIRIQKEIIISASADEIMPLACPVREYDWIENWKCQLIHCPNGKNEVGVIFYEKMSSPFLLGSFKGKTKWTTKVFDTKQYKVHFEWTNKFAYALYKMEIYPHSKSENKLLLDLTYTIKNEKGLKNFDEKFDYKLGFMIEGLGNMLKYYCENKRMLITKGSIRKKQFVSQLSFGEKLSFLFGKLNLKWTNDKNKKRYKNARSISVIKQNQTIRTLYNFKKWFLLILGFAFAMYYFFLLKSYIPNDSDYFASLDEIRILANDTADLPMQINSIVTADGELLKWTIAAGKRSINNSYVQTSFQIQYENSMIIIDLPMNKSQFADFEYGKNFYEDKYACLNKGLTKANKIIFTHEHDDHIGGLSQYLKLNNTNKIILTNDQMQNAEIEDLSLNSILLNQINTINYTHYYKIAPGIILIKSPGHTEGHQMIYVKLHNAEEYLFIGDIVWNMENIKKCKNRPLLAILLGGENVNQLGHLIKWLNEVYNYEDVHIVPSHDIDQLEKYHKMKLIGDSFTFKN